jgi:hypothetical protein
MASTHGPYQVTAWHRQFYSLDPDQPGDTASPAFWTQEAFDSRLAVQPGVLGVGTDTNGEVPVTVEVLDAEPTLSMNGWDQARRQFRRRCNAPLRSDGQNARPAHGPRRRADGLRRG